MNPGDLRHELTLQESANRVADGGGGFTEEWKAVRDGVVWGSIRALSGGERLRAQQTSATATHEIVIRYRDGVSASNRWLSDERTYRVIEPPRASERGDALSMLVREET